MIETYVLVKVEIGGVDEALYNLKGIPEVISAASTTGEYDIIVRVKTKTVDKLHDVVTGTIHRINGIISTKTHIITKEL